METLTSLDDGARRRAALTLMAATVLVLSPVRHHWTRRPVDSFPLSYFPMFSARRSRSGTVVHPVGVHEDGSRTDLSHTLCGDGGFNQVRRQIARTVGEGRAEVLAARVAANVAVHEDAHLATVVAVELVTSSYRYEEFFAGNRTPHRVRVHAQAPVRRVEIVPTNVSTAVSVSAVETPVTVAVEVVS